MEVFLRQFRADPNRPLIEANHVLIRQLLSNDVFLISMPHTNLSYRVAIQNETQIYCRLPLTPVPAIAS